MLEEGEADKELGDGNDVDDDEDEDEDVCGERRDHDDDDLRCRFLDFRGSIPMFILPNNNRVCC